MHQRIAATASGTGGYAAKHRELGYRSFGNSGLVVSEAGFGGYRVDVSRAEHRQALEYALRSGINLIDTSANYADGGSELLVGAVLADMIKRGELERAQVVVVTKAGYLQGGNLELSRQRKAEGDPFPELVIIDPDLEHCIHPVFLAEQLTRSMQRMQLKHIDCLLLHNPEYYLKWANHNKIAGEVAQTEYLRRIESAFRYLESEVERGRIGCYGISSNTFPKPNSDYERTALSAIWSLAEKISSGHHFRVIEFPCNLFEPAAVIEKNQPAERTLLEFAAAMKLTTLINRPLNAIQGDQLIRLAENVYAGEAFAQAKVFRDRISGMDSDWSAGSLSQLAIRSLRSTAGITSVLIGMRKAEYVEDVLQELRQACPVGDRRKAWGAIAEFLGERNG